MKYTYVLRPPELLKILQSLLRRLLSSFDFFHGFGHTLLPFLGSGPTYIEKSDPNLFFGNISRTKTEQNNKINCKCGLNV